MKKIGILITIMFLWIASMSTVYALNFGFGEYVEPTAGVAGYDPSTSETTLAETIGFIIKISFSMIGVIFLSLMIYAGYLWMTARGEDSEADKAKEIIKASVIGLIITLGAYSITNFIVPAVLEKATGVPNIETSETTPISPAVPGGGTVLPEEEPRIE